MRYFVRLNDNNQVVAIVTLPDDYPYLSLSDGTPVSELKEVSEFAFKKYMWLLIISKTCGVRWLDFDRIQA